MEALAIWEVQGQPGIDKILSKKKKEEEEEEKGFSIHLSMDIEEEREARKE